MFLIPPLQYFSTRDQHFKVYTQNYLYKPSSNLKEIEVILLLVDWCKPPEVSGDEGVALLQVVKLILHMKVHGSLIVCYQRYTSTLVYLDLYPHSKHGPSNGIQQFFLYRCFSFLLKGWKHSHRHHLFPVIWMPIFYFLNFTNHSFTYFQKLVCILGDKYI